jgi:hypothetical protein
MSQLLFWRSDVCSLRLSNDSVKQDSGPLLEHMSIDLDAKLGRKIKILTEVELL